MEKLYSQTLLTKEFIMSLRRLVLSFILLLTSTWAAAGENEDPSEGYARLLPMFESGNSFDFASEKGWYTGRCWSRDSENASGALLVLEERFTDGPAFPPVQKFFSFVNSGNAPALYDNLVDPSGVHQGGQIGSTINFWWNVTMPNELQSNGFRSRNDYLRQSADGQFFVLFKHSDTQPFMCYFFARVDG
jgi:hypothetical protein